MRRSVALSVGLAAGLASPWSAFAQTAGGEAVPDMTGGWIRIGKLVETYETIPGYPGAGPLLVDPKHPHSDGGFGQALQWIADISNPILKPATRAKMQIITDEELEGIPHLKDESVCQPSGVPMILNRRGGGAVQIMQTPTQAVILNPRDSQVRFIYLNVPHSNHPGHTWYGESVGHYEGDTLVVDTIGQNAKTQIDRFGTPHSDKIHVIERYRVSPDHTNLEVRFTVDDPGAFTMPWSGRVRFKASSAPFEEQICAENNRFVGRVSLNGQVITKVNIPTATRPDF
jgi:hypothetical protein